MLIFIPAGYFGNSEGKDKWLDWKSLCSYGIRNDKLPKTKQKDKTKKLVLVLISGPSCSLEIWIIKILHKY